MLRRAENTSAAGREEAGEGQPWAQAVSEPAHAGRGRQWVCGGGSAGENSGENSMEPQAARGGGVAQAKAGSLRPAGCKPRPAPRGSAHGGLSKAGGNRIQVQRPFGSRARGGSGEARHGTALTGGSADGRTDGLRCGRQQRRVPPGAAVLAPGAAPRGWGRGAGRGRGVAAASWRPRPALPRPAGLRAGRDRGVPAGPDPCGLRGSPPPPAPSVPGPGSP